MLLKVCEKNSWWHLSTYLSGCSIKMSSSSPPLIKAVFRSMWWSWRSFAIRRAKDRQRFETSQLEHMSLRNLLHVAVEIHDHQLHFTSDRLTTIIAREDVFYGISIHWIAHFQNDFKEWVPKCCSSRKQSLDFTASVQKCFPTPWEPAERKGLF